MHGVGRRGARDGGADPRRDARVQLAQSRGHGGQDRQPDTSGQEAQLPHRPHLRPGAARRRREKAEIENMRKGQ